MGGVGFLVARNGRGRISGGQKWECEHSFPEISLPLLLGLGSVGLLVAMDGVGRISGGQKWEGSDFWRPEMGGVGFLVARIGVKGVPGGGK